MFCCSVIKVRVPLVWSSLFILSNQMKFVNNFFHLFSNFFLIRWNLCCFAFFSLTACIWYHLRFELSTVFLIFLIIYRILFLLYIDFIFLVIAAYPSILYLYCHNCLSQTNDTHLFAVFHSRISTMNGIIILQLRYYFWSICPINLLHAYQNNPSESWDFHPEESPLLPVVAKRNCQKQLNILVRWNRTSGNLGIRCLEVEITYVIMRVYSRSSLSKPYTSRIYLSCSASMLVIFIR